jgi:hypothetical protein
MNQVVVVDAESAPARRGPKPLYSEALKEKFFEAIQAGLTERDACWANGFSEDTLNRWKRGEGGAPEDFLDQLRQVKARRTMTWFNIVRRKAAGRQDKDGNWIVEPSLSAALELIDRCAPEYRKNPRHEVMLNTGMQQESDAGLLAMLKIDLLSPQEQFVFAKLLEKMSGEPDVIVPAIEAGDGTGNDAG